nr:unnamed protein product [Callosobruchus analis]
MDYMIANILHDHNYFTDGEAEYVKTCIRIQDIVNNALLDHDYVGHITAIKHSDLNIIKEMLYSEQTIQNDVYIFEGSICDNIGSSTLDGKKKQNFSTNDPKHVISRSDGIDALLATIDTNFQQDNSNNVAYDTFRNDIIQRNKKIKDCLQNTNKPTNLSTIRTANNVENQLYLLDDKTIQCSNTSNMKFDQPIKQEKDCDEFDPDTMVETLSMFDDLTSSLNIKIEDCISEWNDKNGVTGYAGFKTSELELKHECVCRRARRLVIELRREDADIRPKRQRTKALSRDLAACWSGIDEVWKCMHCSYKAKTNKVLRGHTMNLHPFVRIEKSIKGYVHECVHCPFKTEHKAELDHHSCRHNKRLTSGRSVLICYHCNYTFTSKHTLRHHLLRYKEKKTEYRCHTCSFSAYSRTTLIMHRSNKHPRYKNILCAHCPSMFYNKTNLDEHMLRRHSEFCYSVASKVHKCEKCSYQTTHKSHLRDHMLTHYNVYPYKCKICGYKTNRKSHLTRHLESHVGMSVTSYRNLNGRTNYAKYCSICNMVFKYKVSLDDHIVTCHGNNEEMMKIVTNKIHTCKYCDYKRIRLKAIETHERAHHNR